MEQIKTFTLWLVVVIIIIAHFSFKVIEFKQQAATNKYLIEIRYDVMKIRIKEKQTMAEEWTDYIPKQQQ